MNTIFIPKTIKVGYKNKPDTYTGKLAYIIYYDEKNFLRKEKSWNNWIDHKTDPNDFDNIPTSGFVLNKKVGGYSTGWNHRKTYVRVYDPRDFEFEITIPNLLYILENTSSIKGKGLEGEFVYGWDGKDLLLIPTSSPDYIEIEAYSSMVKNPESILGKDLVLGGTYRTKQGKDWIYLGRFQRYKTSYYDEDEGKPMGNHYFFYNHGSFETVKSLSGKIVMTVSTDPVPNYAELMEKLETRREYSPLDKNHVEYQRLTEKDIDRVSQYYYSMKIFLKINGAMYQKHIRRNGDNYYILSPNKHFSYYRNEDEKLTLEEIKNLELYKEVQFLKNGKPLRY